MKKFQYFQSELWRYRGWYKQVCIDHLMERLDEHIIVSFMIGPQVALLRRVRFGIDFLITKFHLRSFALP